MFERLSIRAQLSMLLLCVLLPAVGLFVFALSGWHELGRQAAERQLAELAQATAARIDLLLRQHAETIARVAERPLVRELDARRCDPALADFAASHDEFFTLAVRRRDGTLLCASRPNAVPAESMIAQPWFRDGLAAGRFNVGGVYARPPRDTWVVILTHPVRDADGAIGGLLVLAVDLLALQQQVLPAAADDAIVSAYDRDLRFLMRTLEAQRWIGQTLPAAQRAQLPDRADAFFELTGVDGVRRLKVGAQVPLSGWRVYAALPLDRVYAGYDALRRRDLVVGGVALLLSLLLAWALGRRIAQPVRALATRAAAIGRDAALPQPAADGATQRADRCELSAVGATLEHLADEGGRLRDAHARLSTNLALMTDAARDIVLLVDAQGRVVQANAAAVAAYGYSLDELRTMTVSDLRCPEQRAGTERDFLAAGRPEGALFETVHRRKDGRAIPVEVSARLVEIGGQPVRMSFVRDVSVRVRHEALLRGQSAVLAMVAEGAPLAESLDALARLVESQAPGLLATILLLDDDGRHLHHGAAPSLSCGYIEAIDGFAVGPKAGSCGTAAYRRAAVVVEDIATDPLWDDWRALALANGLRACWSTPIADAAGRVLGTFAMYARQPGRPEPELDRLIDAVTQVAAVAITADRNARKQREQLAELQRWQALMLDREARMRELKAEADALRARLGEAPGDAGGDRP